MATKTTKATTRKAKTTKRASKAGATAKKKAAKTSKATARTTTRSTASRSTASGSTATRRKKASASSAVATPPAAKKSKKAVRKPASSTRSIFLPRAITSVDDDDVLMAHGGGGGGFGRCGGRLLSSRIEQTLCHKLSIAGVVHSHSPRHYEIRYDSAQERSAQERNAKDGSVKHSPNKVAAYAPMIVLRGRGREGKGVIIEGIEDAEAPILKKIVAFRAQYGQEFYVILVADDDVLDEVPLAAYDESCSSTNVNTLISRLAE